MTMVRLRRCAFAQCVGDALDLAGFGVKRKFLLAGAVVELFSKPGLLRNVRLHPLPGLWTRGELENALALAVLCLAASMEMGYDSDRALRGVIRGTRVTTGCLGELVRNCARAAGDNAYARTFW